MRVCARAWRSRARQRACVLRASARVYALRPRIMRATSLARALCGARDPKKGGALRRARVTRANYAPARAGTFPRGLRAPALWARLSARALCACAIFFYSLAEFRHNWRKKGITPLLLRRKGFIPLFIHNLLYFLVWKVVNAWIR